ncbi:MAG: hypothetical protein A4E26_01181 [Methanobacterium sp. PtaU1.Bin097]|jgi:hypothetical protein|nr:MAG: hypothetical protein A4E26_01181 [Methanobacterium sp. PtaU1.Bin097]
MEIKKIILDYGRRKPARILEKEDVKGEVLILGSEVNIRKVHVKDGVLTVSLKPKVKNRRSN